MILLVWIINQLSASPGTATHSWGKTLFWRFPGSGHGLSGGHGSSRDASQAFNGRRVPIIAKGGDRQDLWDDLLQSQPRRLPPVSTHAFSPAAKEACGAVPAKLVSSWPIAIRRKLACGACGWKDSLLDRRIPGSGHHATRPQLHTPAGWAAPFGAG